MQKYQIDYDVLLINKIHCFIIPTNQIIRLVLWLFKRIHISFLTEVIGCFTFITGNQLQTGNFVM